MKNRISAVLATACAALLASTQIVSAATIGDVVRSNASNPYLLNGFQTRMAFPDQDTVSTWGNPLATEVPNNALPQWNMSGALPLREGSRLVKFGTDPYVYAVGPAGALYWITSASLAAQLYGANWDRRVTTLFSSYYPNYRVAAAIVAPVHPAGTLFKYPDSPAVYYLTSAGTARAFYSEAAFRANRFSFDSVLTIPRSFHYLVANPISGYEKDLNLVLGGA